MMDIDAELAQLKTAVAIQKAKSHGRKRALKMQAAEYERRLEMLNHEAEQLKSMQNKYVPRETYDVDKQKADERYQVDQAWKAEVKGRQNANMIILGIVVALIQLVAHFWKG